MLHLRYTNINTLELEIDSSPPSCSSFEEFRESANYFCQALESLKISKIRNFKLGLTGNKLDKYIDFQIKLTNSLLKLRNI